jgi:thioredoxin reductase
MLDSRLRFTATYNHNVNPDLFDVIIVGGGPAGLSAALVLGRCRRKVLVCDAGNPRNARSEAMHGFLSRDGTKPTEFLATAREEVKCYGVVLREGTVMGAAPVEGGFEVQLLDGEKFRARKLLLATGVVDRVPNIEGLDVLYGKSVHHCPYCDGWEYSDAPIAIYGSGRAGVGLAVGMKTWTQDVVLCSNGPAKLSAREREKLSRNGIDVIEKCITRVEGTAGKLDRIIFDDGSSLSRRAIFFSTGNVQRSELPAALACAVTAKGAVKTTRGQRSSVAGVWVCGDASQDSQYVIVAAAEGAKAAMGINKELQQQDQA